MVAQMLFAILDELTLIFSPTENRCTQEYKTLVFTNKTLFSRFFQEGKSKISLSKVYDDLHFD